MSGQLWFMLGVGVLLGLGAGVPLGLWRGRRVGLEDGYEQGYDEALAAFEVADEHDAYTPQFGQTVMLDGSIPLQAGEPSADLSGSAPPPALAVGHTIYPELVALAALDVPEPASAGVATREPSGFGHPSPYTGPYTPAQRRRDKHKQRGEYACPTGTCDWGDCDNIAEEMRWSESHGWLPVCLDHSGFLVPDPPADVGAWWQAELDALLLDGQSEWLTRNLAGAA